MILTLNANSVQIKRIIITTTELAQCFCLFDLLKCSPFINNEIQRVFYRLATKLAVNSEKVSFVLYFIWVGKQL